MKQKPRWLINAIWRLREIAALRALKDAEGKVIAQGYPNPGEIEQELRRAYGYGKKAKKP